MDEVPFFSQTLKPQSVDLSDTHASKDSARRTQIMVSGLEVFTEKGFHLASMDDIAERAGVSKPILYQHFSSKQDFYLGVLDERVDFLVQHITESIDAAVGNKNRLEAAIACYFKLIDDADHGFRLIFESDFTMNHEVRARVEDVVAQVSRVVGTEVANQTGKSMAELAAIVNRLPQVLINVPNVDKSSVSKSAVSEAVAKLEQELGSTGRILLRPSGTEPLIRVMVEAATADQAQKVAQELADVVATHCALS